jgi:hypothetical protein
MPYERAEQPLSHSALEDMGVPALMKIMMAGSPEDICLFACNPQSLRGHVMAPELPRAGSGSPSREDTWRPWSCPQPGGGSHFLDLKLVRGGTWSSGYRQ